MGDMASREAAWVRLHDPSTDAASLASIAQEYPEFADAVARHPNCYPELRAWLNQYAVGYAHAGAPVLSPHGHDAAADVEGAVGRGSEVEATPDAGSVTPRRRRPRVIVIGAVAAGAVLVAGGVAWAASALNSGSAGEASESAPSTPSGVDPASLGPRQLSGEPVYIGDELEWFLPDDEEVRTFFPNTGDIRRYARIGGIGESEGINTLPSECVGWVLTDSYDMIGARAAAGTEVTLRALQFPTPALAANYYGTTAGTAAACAQFDIRAGDIAYATKTLRSVAQTSAGLAVHALESGASGTETVEVYVLEGNVVIWATVFVPLDDAQASSLLTLLSDRAAQARAQLTEQIGYR